MSDTPNPAMFAGSRKPDPPKPVKRRPAKQSIRLAAHVDEETLRKLRAMKGKQ